MNSIEESIRKEFRDGYHLGRSNSTKIVYWQIQDYQQGPGGEFKVSTYSFPANTVDDKGVNYTPHNVQMPVLE